MGPAELLKTLGYDDSPHFLRAGEREFEAAPAFGHIFRRATGKPGLLGVYTLRPTNATANTPAVPALYVCGADSDAAADQAHRLVWNQDVVPFLLVQTPQAFRLYSGFDYERQPAQQARNLLRTFNTAAELADAGFHADAIDEGVLWRRWGRDVRPEARVDWTLLENLKTLDQWLRANDLDAEASHALIGKYVYLHYLRDRGILSDRKFTAWGVNQKTVFGRDATTKGLEALVGNLDTWLNGSVFPLKFRGQKAPTDDHVRRVAATFEGDEPSEKGHWQLHLDFQAYDFSYIPIETLSVVYEQFLHTPIGNTVSRGREAGAYYTPISVVNFMLAELEDRRPLKKGVRILDPSCGSGAFLVQCYRRLIEKEYPPHAESPRPVQLRELLERSIFGVDRDGDACSVTELSLILTLLDYCNPPDLEDGTRFQLPSLRDKNILRENFFATKPDCLALLGRRRFEWIVGNPPWKGLNPKKLTDDDKPVWEWMTGQQERATPVGDNEVAQAFAWEVGRYVTPNGVIGLLLPAMSLFEDPSRQFREAFFRILRVASVANFANLTEVLFAGRSRDPAAALFYALRPDGEEIADDEYVTAYSPMVANQEVTRPVVPNKRNETWSLVLNASEIRQIPVEEILTGASLPWKLAMWGSHLDLRLLKKMAKKHKTLGDFEASGVLTMSRGPELFASKSGASTYSVVRCDEVVGKKALNVKPLEGLRRIFAFPPEAIKPNEKTYLRSRGGTRGLAICRPPHVIVSEARNFAVLADKYLVVPSGQLGLSSTSNDARLLKAIALYLNSDFAYYHQFLTSSRLGVKRPVATLGSLREMPLPLAGFPAERLKSWAELHDRLVKVSRQLLADGGVGSSLFKAQSTDTESYEALLEELNSTVYEALGLEARERAVVEDLVRVRLELNDGKLGAAAVDAPKTNLLKRYAKRLKAELDGFVGDTLPKRHDVDVIHDDHTGMIQVSLVRSNDQHEIGIYKADDATAVELARTRMRLRRKHAQWVYFDRDLRVFEGRKTFLFKPMQRFHWTESQAMFDASEIIAETINASGATR